MDRSPLLDVSRQHAGQSRARGRTDRTAKMLMIEVLVSSGTDAGRKKRLLAALVEALDGAGTDPNDVMVFFGEIDRANSSFGGGQVAPPVASV